MTVHVNAKAAVPESGAVIDIPLNKLKKSPRNARKVPHSEAAIEAIAASICAKRMLQPLVVEPEFDAAGERTGFYFVSIGEGRRLAQRLRAKRGEIKKTEPIRCMVETALDPHEISLDENVTRSAMHPADEFEAFRELAERRGLGPEDIAARFGVSPETVKRRLRLGAVSPKLLAAYRDGALNLDQVMAFAVTEDHGRQVQVYEQLGANRGPQAIRRAMTEAKVPANDRRAIFVGAEAYTEAGGTILRDLFTEDGGGWFEDAGVLDRLVLDKLEGIARGLREREGWKWAQAHLDYPHGHSCSRVYPARVERTAEEQAEIEAASAEYDALVETWGHVEDLPPDVEARLAEIDAKLEASGDGFAYAPDDLARGGVFVVLSYDGTARIERGLIRPEDLPPAQPDAEDHPQNGALAEDAASEAVSADAEDDETETLAPLSDRLVADLTAHRTMGLRDALADRPDAALLVMIHAAVLRTFYGSGAASCADIRFMSASLAREAEGIEDGKAAARIAERHAGWARQMPEDPAEAWAFVLDLDGDSRMALFAHCVGLTVNAVHGWERRPQAWAHADALAALSGLDMTAYWTATARSYFGRVTKARIAEAVREAVSDEAAEQIAVLKKPEMAQAAEQLVVGVGWLPPLMRTACADTLNLTATTLAAE